jgi:hypothetical protein
MDFDNNLSDQNLPAFRKEEVGSDYAILPTIEVEPPQAPRADKIGGLDEAHLQTIRRHSSSIVANGGDSGIGAGEDETAADGTQSRADVQEAIVIEPWYEDLEIHDKSEGATIVDPTTQERFFWTDPITTLKREIWRPGNHPTAKTTGSD